MLKTLANTVICIRKIRRSPALHVEHIIPKIHGGSDEVENLALAWEDHFHWQGLESVFGSQPWRRVMLALLTRQKDVENREIF